MIKFLLTPFFHMQFLIFKFGDCIDDVTGVFTPVIQACITILVPAGIMICFAVNKNMVGVLFGFLLLVPIHIALHLIVDEAITKEKLKRNNKIIWAKIRGKQFIEMTMDKYGSKYILKGLERKEFLRTNKRLEKWN